MSWRHIVLTAFAMTVTVGSWADCNSALRTDTPAEHFEIVDGGYLVDRATGLMWQRCPLGFQWLNSSCQTESNLSGGTDWQSALKAAAGAAHGEYDDWRLPNIKELETIVDRSCWDPAVSGILFPSTPSALFWTSSPDAVRPDVAAVVDFSKGAHRGLKKTNFALIRLVRDYSSGETD